MPTVVLLSIVAAAAGGSVVSDAILRFRCGDRRGFPWLWLFPLVVFYPIRRFSTIEVALYVVLTVAVSVKVAFWSVQRRAGAR